MKRKAETACEIAVEPVTSTDSFKHLVLHRNRAAILAFEFLWGLAMPFVSVMVLIPGYLKYLGVDNVWIGLAPSIHMGAIALIQPFSAYVIRPGARRLKQMRTLYMTGSGGFVLLGLLVLYGIHAPLFGLCATLVAVGLFAVGAGAGDPHYMEIVVASVSLQQRGRYFGLRAVCLGLGGILGGALTGVLLHFAATPLDFGYCFLAGGLLFGGSTLVLLFYRDDPAPGAARHGSFGDFLRERIVPLVRREQFRWYLISISCFALAACGLPFLPLLIKEKLGATNAIYGWLGGLAMGSTLIMPWMLGIICDRWGSRRGFVMVLFLYTIGVLGCLFLDGYIALFISYLLASIWLPGSIVSMTNLALKLAPDVPTSEVFSTKMVAMAPVQIIGPVLIGAMIDDWSYGPALWTCLACVVLSLLALWRCGPVEEKLTTENIN